MKAIMVVIKGIVVVVLWFARFVVSFLPLIGYYVALKVDLFPALWPPLGSFDKYGAPSTTFAIAVIGWAGPEFFKTKEAEEKARSRSIKLGVVLFLLYAGLLITFVKGVETQTAGTQFRSIGFSRTAQSLKIFDHKPDGEILEKAGLEDKDIDWAWTPASVAATRILIACTYFFVLAFFNLAIGIHMKRESAALRAAFKAGP
jgi:hypothetical protein